MLKYINPLKEDNGMSKYDYEIELLKKNASEVEAKTISMDSYCAIPDQKVTICPHYPGAIDGYHAHDFYEINFVKRGECVNFVEEKALYMPEGSLILMHTDIFHCLYSPKGSEIYNLLIRKDWFHDVISRHPLPDTAMGSFARQATSPSYPEYVFFPIISEITAKLLYELYRGGPGMTLMLEGGALICLREMLIDQNALLSSSMRSSDDVMVKMLSYINANFNTVTLSSLSAHMGYSRTHICRMFQRLLGKSFGDVIGNIRREHAEFLLRTTDKTISSIAISVGYDSVEHFSRLFKRQTGISPGEYRKSARLGDHPNPIK